MLLGFSRRNVVRPAAQKSRRPAPKRRRLELLENRWLLNGTSLLVTNTADIGVGSLRQAISDANGATQLPVTIDFNISTGDIGYSASTGIWTISPQSPLPSITAPVTIDGTSQLGFAGKPVIEMNGSQAGMNADGLAIDGGNSMVESLVVDQFSGDGIRFDVAGGDALTGSYIGTDATGTTADGNTVGVYVTSSGNTIGGVNANPGGTLAGAGNLISGNVGDGILVAGTSASGNVVAGNYVGTDLTGTAALGNATAILYGAGIEINGASNNLIGGRTPGNRNVVSGNANVAHQTDFGIKLSGNNSGNTIEGNYIGTDATGEAPIPNYFGVSIEDGSTDNMIGGVASGAENVISSNLVQVEFDDGAGHRNTVAGNYIGTDAAGSRSLADFGESAGINLNWGNQETIGGDLGGARNVISYVPQVAALISLEFPAACIAEPPACAVGEIRGAELRAS